MRRGDACLAGKRSVDHPVIRGRANQATVPASSSLRVVSLVKSSPRIVSYSALLSVGTAYIQNDSTIGRRPVPGAALVPRLVPRSVAGSGGLVGWAPSSRCGCPFGRRAAWACSAPSSFAKPSRRLSGWSGRRARRCRCTGGPACGVRRRRGAPRSRFLDLDLDRTRTCGGCRCALGVGVTKEDEGSDGGDTHSGAADDAASGTLVGWLADGRGGRRQRGAEAPLVASRRDGRGPFHGHRLKRGCTQAANRHVVGCKNLLPHMFTLFIRYKILCCNICRLTRYSCENGLACTQALRSTAQGKRLRGCAAGQRCTRRLVALWAPWELLYIRAHSSTGIRSAPQPQAGADSNTNGENGEGEKGGKGVEEAE